MAHEHILVLEDHMELREQTRQILANSGFYVQVAATGAEAIATAQREPFDLLVADVYLPDFSGIEAFQQIRRIRPDSPLFCLNKTDDPTAVSKVKNLLENYLGKTKIFQVEDPAAL